MNMSRRLLYVSIVLAEFGVAAACAADETVAPSVAPAVPSADVNTVTPAPAAPAQPAPPPAPPPDDARTIRVPYIPESIRQEIRAQVRAELRQDVVQDVLTQAKEERWGVPGVLPDWIDRVKVKGDLRVREQSEFYAKENYPYYIDYTALNRTGKFTDQLLNTQEERHRLRERLRLGVDANVNNEVKVAVQLSSGSATDPVSTNQTLGNTAMRSPLGVDLAYLQYTDEDADRYPWLTVWAGRMKNPWLSTDLVWYGDLAFEGVAATYRRNLRGSESLMEMSDRDRTLFVTLGAFPIQEVALSARDKWLFGAQIGADLIDVSQSRLRFAMAYYDYVNITGKRNGVDSNLLDYTAPDSMQKGNTLFNIANSSSGSTYRYALAPDYNLVNFTLQYDLASYSPYHVIMTADFVRNIGYKSSDVLARSGGFTTNEVKPRTKGYQAQLMFGWPLVLERGKWRVSYAYKYLERDAVLDAFTDSDFHMGGTDARGWIVSGDYALLDNTWLTARWITSDAIDGPPLSVDVLQLDVNVRF